MFWHRSNPLKTGQVTVSGRHLTRLPRMGFRILKTTLAVFLCLMIYLLRGCNGMVSQSTIAAIICIQPFREDEKAAAYNRIVGTLFGAALGLLFLLLMKLVPQLAENLVVVYALMSVGVALSLYGTVLMKKNAAASLTAIVFLCVVLGFPNLENPILQTLDRVIDTLIGIGVAAIVNNLHFPRVHHAEYVFFVRLQDLVQDRFSTVSSAVLVILNRLTEEGARICLVSKWAPAFLISQMGVVHLHLPVIVMDGAAIYDMEDGSYMDVAAIPPDHFHQLCSILDEMGLGYQIYALRHRTMEIYNRGEMSWAEQKEYDIMKSSPYRNYLRGECSKDDQVTFVRVIDTDAHAKELEAKLRARVPEGMFRIVLRPQPRLEGYSGIYFYDPAATVENRKKSVLAYASKGSDDPVVPFDALPRRSTFDPERDAIPLLNKVRSVYAPIRIPILHRIYSWILDLLT